MQRHGRILETTIYEDRGYKKDAKYCYIPVGEGGKDGTATIDLEDEHLAKLKWGSHTGYARTYINGKATFLHRLVMDAPKGLFVDHINHDKLDNRKSNLRLCTNTENIRNRRLTDKNTSGYKGVHFCKRNQNWTAKIQNKWLGVFDDPVEAAKAYNRAAIKNYGEFALINKIGE